MARYGSHRHCGVDGWLAEKVQTQLGILAVPVKQRALDRLGLARPRLRPHRPPTLPRIYKHPRRVEEHHLLKACEMPRTCPVETIAIAGGVALAAWLGSKVSSSPGLRAS